MSARILQFHLPPDPPKRHDEQRFEASVDERGHVRIVIGDARGSQTWTLTPSQAVELAEFLNNDWMGGRT
jgi:hypothetical protein